MQSKAITTGILKALAILAGIVLLVAFIYKIQSVLIYITIAAVVSLIGRPIVLFLRRKLKFPNLLAVLITMIIVYGTFLGIMALFIPLIVEQGQNLSLLDINGLKENLQSLFGQIQAYFEIQKIDLTAALENFDWSSTFSFSAIPNLLNGIFGTMGSLSIGLFSII